MVGSYCWSWLPYMAMRTSNSGRLSAVLYHYKEIDEGNFRVNHRAIDDDQFSSMQCLAAWLLISAFDSALQGCNSCDSSAVPQEILHGKQLSCNSGVET